MSGARNSWNMAGIAALGAMGAVGVPITITTAVLPSVLLALGCAYSLHLLSAASSTSGSERTEALLEVSFPIALSGLTTSLGLLAVSFVRIDAIRGRDQSQLLGFVIRIHYSDGHYYQLADDY